MAKSFSPDSSQSIKQNLLTYETEPLKPLVMETFLGNAQAKGTVISGPVNIPESGTFVKLLLTRMWVPLSWK